MSQVPVEKKAMPARVPDPFRALRSEMDQLFDRFTTGFGLPGLGRMLSPAWTGGWRGEGLPAVDITEDATAYKLTAELPGLTEKEVEVTLSNDALTLKGEKREEHEEKNENRYVSERSYGAFQRSFPLPREVDREKVTAAFANGVLTITLPKTAEARKQEKKIEVKKG